MPGKKRSPLHPLFEQLAEIFNIFYDKKNKTFKTEVPEDIEEQIAELRFGVEVLKQVYQKALKDSDIDEKEVLENISRNPDQVDTEHASLLRQAQVMKREAMAIHKALGKATEEQRKRKTGKGKKTKKLLRKKDLGQKKGWKRL